MIRPKLTDKIQKILGDKINKLANMVKRSNTSINQIAITLGKIKDLSDVNKKTNGKRIFVRQHEGDDPTGEHFERSLAIARGNEFTTTFEQPIWHNSMDDAAQRNLFDGDKQGSDM